MTIDHKLLRFDPWRHNMYVDLRQYLSTIPHGTTGCEFGGSNGIIQSFMPDTAFENYGYPPHDICNPESFDKDWDVIVIDQIIEHVESPWIAIDNICSHARMAIITMPFAYCIHPYENEDNWRLTPHCLRRLLSKYYNDIYINSWGNIKVNYWANTLNSDHMVSKLFEEHRYNEIVEQLRINDPLNPFVIWAVARNVV